MDYICPQIYFGFNHSTVPYTATVAQFNKMIKVDSIKLYIGLAAYKVGAVDNYAGAGKNEWLNNSDMLSRMVDAARGYSRYGGFMLFRYDSMYSPASGVAAQMKTELKALKAALSRG